MAMLDDSKCLLRPKIMHRRTLLASFNCDGPLGVALLAALALPWLLLAGGPQWTVALRYDRLGLHSGEWWRLVSAHWVHLGVRHLSLDSAGLVLLWTLYARALRPWDWLAVLIGATAMIDAGLWWAQPQVQWYVGLSGLLHGAWAAGAAAEALRRGGWAWLMPAVLALKLVLEQRAGASLLAPEVPVLTIAHLFGALGGLGAYAALALAREPL
jgi:rhomboid family GlyGly-CTERM serine protease